MARGRPPKGSQRLRRPRGVLSEIEAHGREAEQLHGPAHRLDEVGGKGRAVRLLQRPLHETEIVDQLVGIAIVQSADLELAALRPDDGGVELAQHAGEELAIWLARIARGDRLRLAAHPERVIKLVGRRPAGREARVW